MKISIITIVKNNKETIKDAIESVLAQTYQDIEYIVVDGASTDGTIEIVKSYRDRVAKFISEPDKGIYDGLNKGVSLATGSIVAFLHSDDIYASKTIVDEVATVFETNDVDGVYGDLIYTPKNDINKVLRYWQSKTFKPELLKQGWMPAHPTLFLKKEVYEKYGNFDLKFKIAADYDFMLRVLKSGVKVKYVSKLFYIMRSGGESNKSIGNIILKSREDLSAISKNGIGGLSVLFYKNLFKIGQFFVARISKK